MHERCQKVVEELGIFAPMLRASISCLTKSHVTQICTRPTCSGILGDDMRKQIIFKTEVFF